MRSQLKGPKPGRRMGLGTWPWGRSNELRAAVGVPQGVPSLLDTAAGAAAPVGASHGHCPQWRGPGWSRVGSLKLNLESHPRTRGSCVECLQVPHNGFGPVAVELDMGCEGRAGLKALSRVNVTATVVDGPTTGMPTVCSIFLPSQKDVGRCSCFLPKQHSSQLIFSISFFPHPIFHSGLAGHIRIPAKYLLNQDSDLCSGFSVLIC